VQSDLPVLAAVAVLAVGAMVVSFLHLGRPRNALRALSNVRSSWLSREVLFMTLFAAASVALVALEVVTLPRIDTGQVEAVLAGGAALAGVGLLYSMVRVYRLRTVPAWDTAGTAAGFFGTALILGTLGWIWVGQVVVFAATGNGARTADNGAGVVAAGVALLVAALAAAWARTRFYASHERVGV
jgi:DMSO reductase anchor subunit